MHKITFECEVITPMFLAGADGQTPELRPPSIKGAMRFWWRAMNGHLGLEELKRQENKLFGGSDNGGNRSQMILRTRFKGELDTGKEKMVPHSQRANGMMQWCIKKGQKYDVIISSLNKEKIDFFKNLFVVTSYLGGIGKRVRRGMGAWKINTINDDRYNSSPNINDLYDSLKQISDRYTLSNDKIILSSNERMSKYPWITTIEIGKGLIRNLPHYISKKTHDFKGEYGRDYEPSMGHTYKGRFASPIYVSIIEQERDLMPIISTLNTVPDKFQNSVNLELQAEFKNSILR